MIKTYDFSFERTQLTKVIAGLVSLVVLVFCAGVLIGIVLQSIGPAPTLVVQVVQPPPKITPPINTSSATDPVLASVADENTPAVESDDEAAVDPDRPAVEERVEKAKKEESPKAAEAEFEQPSTPGSFAVQLGAFLQRDHAGILAKSLAGKGYNADVVAFEDSHGRTWYLVRFGMFPSRSEASAMALELRSQANLNALVRPSNSM